jgi:aromatic ring-opening dioxygenase catalytic subunit (LigB family)
MTASAALPSLYIPHGGGPCFFMDWDPPGTWERMRAWLAGLIGTLPARPEKLLVISAHWESAVPSVTASPAPELLFDYYGFPPHTYELTWPAPGDPALARRVGELFDDAGIAHGEDPARGYDHGVFVPMKVAVPEADIPTVALSLRVGLDPAFHLAMGRALAPLREEGVLIVGSGMSFHNLRAVRMREPLPDAVAFDDWLTDAMEGRPEDRATHLAQWAAAPGARLCHPREEHLIPICVASGAADDRPGVKIFSDDVAGGRVSAFAFG